MIRSRTNTSLRIALALAAAGLLLLVSACSGKATETGKPAAGTAKASVGAAESALTTMAPEAKLLQVSTAQTTAPDTKPVWMYIFGSADNGKMYSVTVTNGKAMGATEIGDAPLEKDEWASVPDTDAWKVDSDEAFDKAVKAAGAGAEDMPFAMLLATYQPRSGEGQKMTKPFVWYVGFQPPKKGTPAKVIEVNAETGAATDTSSTAGN